MPQRKKVYESVGTVTADIPMPSLRDMPQSNEAAGFKRVKEVTIAGIWVDDTPQMRSICPYEACPKCDGCAVCGDFHGNFVGGCGEDCPYTPAMKKRDATRREELLVEWEKYKRNLH